MLSILKKSFKNILVVLVVVAVAFFLAKQQCETIDNGLGLLGWLSDVLGISPDGHSVKPPSAITHGKVPQDTVGVIHHTTPPDHGGVVGGYILPSGEIQLQVIDPDSSLISYLIQFNSYHYYGTGILVYDDGIFQLRYPRIAFESIIGIGVSNSGIRFPVFEGIHFNNFLGLRRAVHFPVVAVREPFDLSEIALDSLGLDIGISVDLDPRHTDLRLGAGIETDFNDLFGEIRGYVGIDLPIYTFR